MENPISSLAHFTRGDWVRIHSAPGAGLLSQIVELRGPLGPNGCQIYRVKIKADVMKPVYVEVREDQLVAAENPGK